MLWGGPLCDVFDSFDDVLVHYVDFHHCCFTFILKREGDREGKERGGRGGRGREGGKGREREVKERVVPHSSAN